MPLKTIRLISHGVYSARRATKVKPATQENINALLTEHGYPAAFLESGFNDRYYMREGGGFSAISHFPYGCYSFWIQQRPEYGASSWKFANHPRVKRFLAADWSQERQP